MRTSGRHARVVALMAAVVPSLALLLGLEGALRLAGFRYAHYPISMRYVRTLAALGAEQTLHERTFRIDYTLDPVLLWRPLPSPGITNAEGFLGPDWSPEKPAATTRVAALGDSCTVAGDSPYPAQLGARLASGRGPRFEVWNAGVGSWSSYQGRRLLETRLARYRPDVVTVYFGWNDHWLAWAAPDKDLSRLLDRQFSRLRVMERSRLLQGMLRLADRARGGPRFSASTPLRVSLEDYRENLGAIVRQVRVGGGEAVLVTAPTALTPEHPVTLALCEQTHNFFDPRRIREVHDAYNAQVRAVAEELGAPLVDAAARFDRRPGAERLFKDGIHLTAEGHRVLAEMLEPAVRLAARR